MKRLLSIAISVVVCFTLISCGEPPKTGAKAQDSATNEKEFKACMVSDQGGFSDKSFNESGKNGLDRAQKELNIKVATAESKGPEDFKKNVDSLIAQKCDLVIGVGFVLNDAIREGAKANPNINFAIVDAKITEQKNGKFEVLNLPNAKPLLFNTAEAAFLAGYSAAGMTKTGIVATYGGMSIPAVDIFRDGFYQGIKQYNLDNKKDVKLLGWDYASQQGAAVGNFDDQAKGKQLTESFIASNADIILPVAGPVGLGTLSAVKGTDNSSVIWVDADGYESTQYGSIILTSIVKKISEAVFDTIKSANEGKFSNEPYIGTLANKGVYMAPYHDFANKVPAELKEKIEKYADKIAKGELVVETKNKP